MTKKQGYILDHWGKGSPSAAETAVLDQEVEILKKEMEASRRKISKVSTQDVLSNFYFFVYFFCLRGNLNLVLICIDRKWPQL